jgi:hypothetical protein
MNLPLRVLPLVMCLSAGPVPATAQNDQGVLIISRGGQEIGRESFRRVANRSDPSIVDSLTSIARFPATKPALELSAIWGRSGTDAFTMLLDRRGTGVATSQILVAGGRSRITVRLVGKGGESANEFPGGLGVVVLEDSLFAPYLQIAALAEEKLTPMTALFPRSGRRVAFQAERVATPPANPLDHDAIQEIRLTGGLNGEIQLDAGGRLIRIVRPDIGVEASRAP